MVRVHFIEARSPYGEDCLRGRILALSAGRKPLPQNTGAACELKGAPSDAPTSGEFWDCLLDPNAFAPPNVQGVIFSGSGTLES